MRTKLWVSNKPVEMNRFVEDLLGRVSVAMVSALKGTDEMREFEIVLAREGTKITVNGRDIPLNPFTEEVIGNTLRGLISSLKGVGDTSLLSVSVEVE